jgi:hypothetical protein
MNQSNRNVSLIIYKVSDVERFYPSCIVTENLSQWNPVTKNKNETYIVFNKTTGRNMALTKAVNYTIMEQTKGRMVKTYNRNCVNNLLINDKDKTIQTLKSQLATANTQIATATTKLNSMETKVNQLCASASMTGVCK